MEELLGAIWTAPADDIVSGIFAILMGVALAWIIVATIATIWFRKQSREFDKRMGQRREENKKRLRRMGL